LRPIEQLRADTLAAMVGLDVEPVNLADRPGGGFDEVAL